MATRKIQEPITRTLFVISREEFKKSLHIRIEKGQKLIEIDIKTEDELESVNSEFNRWENYNKEILKQSFNKPDNEYYYEYSRVNSSSGLMDYIQGVDTQSGFYKIKKLKQNIENSINELKQLIEKSELIQEDTSIAKQSPISKISSSQVVYHTGFLVHGHNEKWKLEVARFIENEIKKKVIILHEQPNRGNTIIEKFEYNSNVDFAIALWTADDLGKGVNEVDLKKRARQNSIFETGFFIGKLGRSNVIVLYEDGVELPSDYNGIIFIPLVGNWMHGLKREVDALYNTLLNANNI